jgi:uncharacterized membrane protein
MISEYMTPELCSKLFMPNATHLHAMLVHFPVALLIVGFAAELSAFFFQRAFFRKAAFYLLLSGTIGTIAAYLAGKAAGEGMDEGAVKNAMDLHEQAATISLWMAVLTTVFYTGIGSIPTRKGWFRIVGMVLFAALVTGISYTGYRGGQLVYRHAAGVELALPDFSNPEEK